MTWLIPCHERTCFIAESVETMIKIPMRIGGEDMALLLVQMWSWDFSYPPYSVNRNDPKFSDRYVLANSADPDQTAPRGAI